MWVSGAVRSALPRRGSLRDACLLRTPATLHLKLRELIGLHPQGVHFPAPFPVAVAAGGLGLQKEERNSIDTKALRCDRHFPTSRGLFSVTLTVSLRDREGVPIYG